MNAYIIIKYFKLIFLKQILNHFVYKLFVIIYVQIVNNVFIIILIDLYYICYNGINVITICKFTILIINI